MRPRFHISIAATYASNIVFITIFTGSMIGLIAYLNTQNVINELSSQLFRQSSSRVIEKIAVYMKVPQQLNRMNADDIISNHLEELSLRDHLAGQLFTDLKFNTNVISIEYADEKLNYVGPVRNIMGVPYAIGFASPETKNTLELYASDETGRLKEKVYEIPNYDSREMSWYKRAVEAKRPTWTDVYVWPNGDIGLDAVYPMYHNNELIGVLDSSIRITELRDFLIEAKPTTNSKVVILDDSGKIVVGTAIAEPYLREGDELTRMELEESTDPIYRAAIKQIGNEKGELVLPMASSVEDRFVYEGKTHLVTASMYTDDYDLKWYLLTISPIDDFIGTINTTRVIFGSLIFFVALLSVLLGLVLARRITAPLIELNNVAKRYGDGDLDAKPPTSSSNEIGQLANTFTYMANKIKKTLLSLKEKEQIAVEKQEKYRSERDKVEAILESIGDGVFVIDQNQLVTMINPVALELIGYTKNEVIGKNYKETLRFVYENDLTQTNEEFIQRAFLTKKVQEMSNHTVLITKDGSRIPVADSAAPLTDDNGEIIGCVIVFRDVTQERAVDRAKTEFVSLASHQLRTPLTSIGWNAELLNSAEGNKGLTDKQKELIAGITKGNKRMIALVNALLDTSHFELGIFAKNITKLYLPDELKQVVSLLKNEIGTKKLKLEVKVEDNFPIYQGDERLVTIIMQNIISNAVKYTPDKGSIAISLSYTKSDIRFTVKDSGIGIPKEQQQHVFDKLFRADNARATATDGTGLGLYLVKLIIDSVSGRISFVSTENKGTTFTVLLPRKGM